MKWAAVLLCGWVLWSRIEASSYSPMAEYETLRACQQAAATNYATASPYCVPAGSDPNNWKGGR